MRTMKTFSEALNYIKTTPAKNIAKRTAIYGAYFNMYRFKNFGHDIILDIVAALCGPFDYDMANDKKILELLDNIEYGFNPNWPNMMIPWINKYATSKKEADAFVAMVNYLFTSTKTDEIYEEFNYICQVIRPSEFDYFPEMNAAAAFSYNPNRWERI